MTFQQTNDQYMRRAVTDAIVHITKFCMSFLLQKNQCLLGLASRWLLEISVFQAESGGLSHHHIISLALFHLSLSCFILKDQEIQDNIFFTNLFLVFYVLKIIIEITYWNSRRTSVIILFSSKGKIFVHSQKLPLVWEGFSIPVLLLIKLLVVLTYSPVLTEYSEVFVRIWVFASFVYWMVSLSYRFSFSWSIDPSRF